MSDEKAEEPKKHLHFIITLHDPTHSLRFSTVSQPSPADWLEVEYEMSDWVEERLVDVLRTGMEVLAQDVSAYPVDYKWAFAMLLSLSILGSARWDEEHGMVLAHSVTVWGAGCVSVAHLGVEARGDWLSGCRKGVDRADEQYVATRMGLKTSAANKAAVAASLSADAPATSTAEASDAKKD